MKTIKNSDVVVVGFAIFATFFGAGNLIFPTYLGFSAGDGWSVAMFGFFLSGIMLPVLSIIAVGKNGGAIENITDNVGPLFSKVFTLAVMVIILVLVGLPRIGAVTTELGVQPLFDGVSPIAVAIVFYAISIVFSINPSGVVDKIGRYLTPILLLVLAVILFKGIFDPVAAPVSKGVESLFKLGFMTGYEIGDALGGIVIASLFISAIADKGYTDKKSLTRVTILAGSVGGLGLFVVYGGLIYIGSTGASLFPADIEKSGLLAGVVQHLLGNVGVAALSLAVIFACLTTAIGISSAVAKYFTTISNGRLPYKVTVIVINVVAGVLSITGVSGIMGFAMPILLTAYPVAIVIIFLGLFSEFLPNRGSYVGAVYSTLLISAISAMSMLGMGPELFSQITAAMPFAQNGFAWVAPALVGLILGTLISPVLTTKKVAV